MNSSNKLYCLRYQLVICFFCLACSCNKAGIFEQAGEQTTETRNWQAYNEILLYDKVNLVLTYDTVENISVQAGKNLLPAITTIVDNGKLTIRDENILKWSRSLAETVTVYISGKELNKITYYGSGTVSSSNRWTTDRFEVDSWDGVGSFRLSLDADYLRLIIRKANADITVNGRARLTSAYLADHGSIDLSAFPCDSVVLDCRSIRKSVINVKEKLDVNIHYTGDIYYFGNPIINLFRNNSGTLIKAG